MHRVERVTRRRLPVAVALLAVTAGLLVVLQSASASPRTTAFAKIVRVSDSEPLCWSHASLCTDVYDKLSGDYVGHDEPSLEFKSGCPGQATTSPTGPLPDGPEGAADAGGSGPTWNFELRPTFWFGLTLCDTESAPEYTKTCTPNSDANNLVGTNPNGAELHREASGQRVHGAAVLRPGLRASVRGLRLHGDAVLRRDDHRQPQPRSEHRGGPTAPACDDFVLGGDRADQLGVHHEERPVSQAPADPAVHRHVRRIRTSPR